MRATVIAALLLSAPSAWAFRATVASQSDFKVGAHPTIVVSSSAGAVDVDAGPAGSVHVDITRQADSEEAARRLDVVTRQDGDTIVLEFKHKNGMWHDNVSVSFRVTAPADAKLQIATGGGSVTVRGIGGGMKVDTGGGGITVDGAAGALALHTGGGSVEVRRASGSVDVSTGGGSVRVEGALSGQNRVHTGGGSIHVAVPASSRLTVDAETGGGSAHNDFGIPGDGERHSGRFRGSIGDGGAGSLELRTGGGSISLSKRG